MKNKKKIFSNVCDENNENINTFYINLSNYDIYKFSINLSIYICYYLKLDKRENREEFCIMMNHIFDFDFMEIPKKEQEFLANNIKIVKGIAKNRILLENLFVLFTCINAKVPLII